jgi:anthranilate phosphoribosyltransferase
LDALRGGDLSQNSAILEQVLRGQGLAAQRDVVALNTAMVLWVAGVEQDFRAGAAMARQSLDQGHPWQRLETLRLALADGSGQ